MYLTRFFANRRFTRAEEKKTGEDIHECTGGPECLHNLAASLSRRHDEGQNDTKLVFVPLAGLLPASCSNSKMCLAAFFFFHSYRIDYALLKVL
mmetsp:Transcript_20803/g.42772  ORF Transcript_20803/g.42772 Transcript_20803/m.42772 type:complete len:94 (+) Transcript_20803:486-767(+)